MSVRRRAVRQRLNRDLLWEKGGAEYLQAINEAVVKARTEFIKAVNECESLGRSKDDHMRKMLRVPAELT